MFLLTCCQLVIVVLIFGVVIRKKSGKGLVDGAPSLRLVTFVEETPMMKHRVVTHTVQDKK